MNLSLVFKKGGTCCIPIDKSTNILRILNVYIDIWHLSTYNKPRDLDYLTDNISIFVGQKGTISLIFNVQSWYIFHIKSV